MHRHAHITPALVFLSTLTCLHSFAWKRSVGIHQGTMIVTKYSSQEGFDNNTILLKTLKKAVDDKVLEKHGGMKLHLR